MQKKSEERVSRRAALQGLGIGLGATAIGCAGEVPSTDEADQTRAQDLLAGIDHVVVLMMENRSFDHFLGALASDAAYPGRRSVEGLTGRETNPGSDGTPVPVFKLDNFTPEDPPHGWDAEHRAYNSGRNDGFVKEHAGPSERDVMGFHDRSQIPLYYWFADNFTVCDHWHASVLGPTWPNRFFLHATTSNGKKDNTSLWTAPRTIWKELASRGLKGKNYAAGTVAWFVGAFPGEIFGTNPTASIDAFFEDARNGRLPHFSLIDPDFWAADDHPSHNIQRGQAFVASVYKAIAESPNWSKTLFIITYDENGGFFDHVPPPATDDDNPEFRQLGFRVPAFVIGPTVKKGFVSSRTLEHSSVAATLKSRWQIGNLTRRMAAAHDVTDAIDPEKVGAPAPPPPGMPPVVMTMHDVLYDGVGTSSQPGLDAEIASGRARAINPADHQERIRRWLDHAVRLGAVRIVG
jgi:phospholipase C